MSLTHDPFQHLRLFEDAITRLVSEPRAARPWAPPVDIFENENELVLKADLPDHFFGHVCSPDEGRGAAVSPKGRLRRPG